MEFRHHLYIYRASPDDGPTGLKHDASGIIKTFVCTAVTSQILFESNTNRMEHYRTVNMHARDKVITTQ
jgi:hypothetical protein